VRAEDLVEHTQHERVDGEVVEAADLGEQRVDAPGAEPFEVVPPRRCGVAERRQLGPERRDLIGWNKPLDHRRAALPDRRGNAIR
jgi:hypothetical protein